jgi:4-amino-4-deoxy-L-arabinose transferase-like glycosyltransferase
MNSENFREKPHWQLIMLCVVLLAIILRIHHIDYESLFMDELRQVSFYKNNPEQLIHLAARQQQPPLDYWIGHYFLKISDSDFFLRLPAALFGTGSVALLMLIVARITTWSMAGVVGIAMALMPFPIYFSQEARPYSIAIFFILFTLWSLDKYLHGRKLFGWTLALLFCSVLGLLFSRTLSPLVFVTCLFVISLSMFALFKMNKLKIPNEVARKFPIVGLGIIVALMIYWPVLHNILQHGGRYASQPTQLGLDALLHGLSKFSLLPLWEAFIAQLEPIGLIVLSLIIGSFYLVVRENKYHRDSFVLIIILILPSAALANLFIFQAKTSFPFRPPYPVYLLPLCLIISTIFLQHLLDYIKAKSDGIYVITITFLASSTTALLLYTLVDFKGLTKHTDWKGVANYLSTTYGNNDLLLFDGLVKLGKWKPAFYGLSRYYNGSSYLLDSNYVPQYFNFLKKVNLKPALILFYYRDYYLTHYSSYPIIPSNGKVTDYSRIFSDPALTAKQFTGFIVVRLKHTPGPTLGGVSVLLNRTLSDVEHNEQVTGLLLTASFVDKKLGLPDWRRHLNEARKYVSNTHDQKYLRSIENIEKM